MELSVILGLPVPGSPVPTKLQALRFLEQPRSSPRNKGVRRGRVLGANQRTSGLLMRLGGMDGRKMERPHYFPETGDYS